MKPTTLLIAALLLPVLGCGGRHEPSDGEAWGSAQPSSELGAAPSGGPIIYQNLRNTFARAGDSVSFKIVTMAWGQSRSYQWFKDGNPIPDVVGDTLQIPNAAKADEGTYSVRVTAAGGSTLSREATLRLVDQILLVSSDLDSGPFTLRSAIQQANSVPGVSGIFVELPPPQRRGRIAPRIFISLRSPLPVIQNNMIVEGSGDGEIIISGSNRCRPFFIDSGVLELADLTISGGVAKGGDSWGGGGGAGMGGALFVNGGEVRLERVNFVGNRAVGGSSIQMDFGTGNGGGAFAPGLRGGGGGMGMDAPMGGSGGDGTPLCGTGGPGQLLSTPAPLALGQDAGGADRCSGDGAGGGAAFGGTLLNLGGKGGWGGGGGWAQSPGIAGDGGGNGLGPDWFGGGGGGIAPNGPGANYGEGGLWGGTGDTNGQGGGGAGLGGAIFLRRGQISRMESCRFIGNEATPGLGALNPADQNTAKGKGGAIYIFEKPYPYPVNDLPASKGTCGVTGSQDLIYPLSVLLSQYYENNVAPDAGRGSGDDTQDFYRASCAQAPVILQNRRPRALQLWPLPPGLAGLIAPNFSKVEGIHPSR